MTHTDLECGCTVTEVLVHEIEAIEVGFCPLHKSASDLLEALEIILDEFGQGKITLGTLTDARVIVAQAKGETPMTSPHLIAAAPDLLKAAEKLEAAESAHANCPECDGQDIPELCPRCFPLFDDARLSRRAAIARAKDPTP